MPDLSDYKPSDRYMLRSLHGTYYLIPTVQDIAMHRNAIKLNDTGLIIWNAIINGVSMDKIPSVIRHRLTADGIDMSSVSDAELSDDAYTFIHSLIRQNALMTAEYNDSRLHSGNTGSLSFDACYKIGGLTIGFNGCTDCLDISLEDFRIDRSNGTGSGNNNDNNGCTVDQLWRLRPLIDMPEFDGHMIIHTVQLELFESGGWYVMTFPCNRHLLMCRVTTDGTVAEFFYDHRDMPEARTELFYGLRNVFLVAAQQHGMFALHSASIKYNGYALLFCGQSGTGKSTHTAFWHELFGTPYLNGDLNLTGIEDGVAYVYGIPWCGTSGIYTTDQVPVGAITLLRQASDNHVSIPSPDSAQLLVAQRMISPTWCIPLADMNLDYAGRLQDCCHILKLSCTASPDAACVMKAYIDNVRIGGITADA